MSLLRELMRRFDLLSGRSSGDSASGVSEVGSQEQPRERRESHGAPVGSVDVSGVPQRHAFLAVVEALQDDVDAVPASSEVGRQLADDGVSLPEALDGLHAAYNAVTGTEPAFDAVRALGQSWSDSSLTYLHSLSCEDPLTGLASLAHLRSRLNELYREADLVGTSVSSTRALVVVEAPAPTGSTSVDRELRLVDIAECLRIVYCGGEVLARMGSTRGAALVARGSGLPEQVDTVRGLITAWRPASEDLDGRLDLYPQPRVWIEGLPSSVEWVQQ